MDEEKMEKTGERTGKKRKGDSPQGSRVTTPEPNLPKYVSQNTEKVLIQLLDSSFKSHTGLLGIHGIPPQLGLKSPVRFPSWDSKSEGSFPSRSVSFLVQYENKSVRIILLSAFC